MTSQPTQERRRPVAAPAPPEDTDRPGYESLVCESCGRANGPRPTTRHATLPCLTCGANAYRRLPVVALEQSELELLIELVEHAAAGRSLSLAAPTTSAPAECARVLETLYAERRYVPTTLEENDHEA